MVIGVEEAQHSVKWYVIQRVYLVLAEKTTQNQILTLDAFGNEI